MSDAERRERAKRRRERGISVERIDSLDEEPPFRVAESIEERLTVMTRLCRAAWLATGQSFPPSGRAHRSSLPGEVYFPRDVS